CGGGRGAVALVFELEQAAVEVPAELEKAGQVEVGEQPAGAKGVGVVEGGLGPERPSPFQVLLNPGVAALNVEADLDALVEGAGAGCAGGAGRGGHAVGGGVGRQRGATEIEEVAGDGGEELASMKGAVEDLGAADLDLEHREHVAVAGLAVLGGEGTGQAVHPAVEVTLDVGGPEAPAEAA